MRLLWVLGCGGGLLTAETYEKILDYHQLHLNSTTMNIE